MFEAESLNISPKRVPLNTPKMHKMLRRYNSLIVLPYSMKQIPFTVPQHTTPPAMRHDRSEENFSSEPSSPSSKRPSVEIPGKPIHVFLLIEIG